jgi:hypothetical protein
VSGRRLEYRVVWQRYGSRRKTRVFAQRSSADRFVLLFGPEPWRAYNRGLGADPEARACERLHDFCEDCGCDGRTVREDCELRRANMPPLQSIHMEIREVGPWITDLGANCELRHLTAHLRTPLAARVPGREGA